MKPKKLRFAAGVTVVIGAIIYFALSGFQEGKAYYKTLDELAMERPDENRRLRVAGIVSEGTIVRDGATVRFQIEQEQLTLAVNYTGSQPIPDTFKAGVEAIVEGHLEDGTFEADQIQAKCASKYEAEYGTVESDSTTAEARSY